MSVRIVDSLSCYVQTIVQCTRGRMFQHIARLFIATLLWQGSDSKPSPQWNCPIAVVPKKVFRLGERDREGGISLTPRAAINQVDVPSHGSHLFYTISLSPQQQATVKVHRVLPSFPGNSASARRFQFHWACAGDSGAVVTPFMQVRTSFVLAARFRADQTIPSTS